MTVKSRGRDVHDLGIPAGQPDYTPKSEKDRMWHMRRMKDAPTREDLLLEDASRTRERLLQIELSAGANASYEEQAGNYALAQAHRKYANYCKAVRLNRPLPESLQNKPQHKEPQ